MNITKRIIPFIAVAALAGTLCMTASAASVNNRLIKLPYNQEWTSNYSVGRTGNNRDVGAQCSSVYPISAAIDTFSKIQFRVVNGSGTLIIDEPYVVLNEGDSDFTYCNLKNGYLGLTEVNFQFRGNSVASANAVVSYTGR